METPIKHSITTALPPTRFKREKVVDDHQKKCFLSGQNLVRSAYPISTGGVGRGADYAYQIILASPDGS